MDESKDYVPPADPEDSSSVSPTPPARKVVMRTPVSGVRTKSATVKEQGRNPVTPIKKSQSLRNDSLEMI